MRQAISKLLGLKTGPAPTEPPHSQSKVVKRERAEDPDNPHSIEDNSDNATRRQLIQMMLRDGLRKHGIPPGWVECRMLVVNSRSRGPGVYVRLVMRHWDMLLLTYANAFQQQFMAAITEFEPQASVWLHGISWELDVGETCPYMDMPDPSIWLELSQPARSSMPVVAAMLQASPPEPAPAPVPAAAAPSAQAPSAALAGSDEDAEVLQDLERMFAIRDANIKQQAFADTTPLDFQNTEPAKGL